jgi:hypothetical protein
VQQASLAEWTASAEVANLERAHMLGDNTVEAAHLFDLLFIHSLTLVRE